MKPKIKILSIDGGGIRGILPAAILVEIERLTQRPISDLFDLMAGTSTGGIITCALNIPHESLPKSPRFAATDVAEMYEKRGNQIFKKRGGFLSPVTKIFEESFEQDGLEALLKSFLGDTELRNTRAEVLITSYDIELRKPFYFLSRLAKQYPDAENFLLRDIARATSAAPTYFEPEQLQWQGRKPLALIDGGVFANNPSMLAYTEGLELLQQRSLLRKKKSAQQQRATMAYTQPSMRSRSDLFMLSLGTGNITMPYYYHDARKWGLAQWLRPCLDILMQGVSETVDYQMQYVLPPLADGTPSYARINPEVPEKYAEMSDVSSDNIAALMEIAQNTVREKRDLIETICEIISK